MRLIWNIDSCLEVEEGLLKKLEYMTKNLMVHVAGLDLQHVSFSSDFNAHICVHVIPDKVMKELHLQSLGVSQTTDVLTFPYYDDLGDDLGSRMYHQISLPEEVPFSEIYISWDVAIQQAQNFQHTLESEIIILLVHGILHSLGFDHERSVEDALIMQKHEKVLIKKLGLTSSPVTTFERL